VPRSLRAAGASDVGYMRYKDSPLKSVPGTFRDIATSRMDFCFRWKSARAADTAATTAFDPELT